ncbi:unnamed protein product, partial [Laminaria digitata]
GPAGRASIRVEERHEGFWLSGHFSCRDVAPRSRSLAATAQGRHVPCRPRPLGGAGGFRERPATRDGVLGERRAGEAPSDGRGHNLGLERLAFSGCFAVEDSPIWADGSTERYAAELEKAMGGAARLAELTGSRAHLRQGAPQIMKVAGL